MKKKNKEENKQRKTGAKNNIRRKNTKRGEKEKNYGFFLSEIERDPAERFGEEESFSSFEFPVFPSPVAKREKKNQFRKKTISLSFSSFPSFPSFLFFLTFYDWDPTANTSC